MHDDLTSQQVTARLAAAFAAQEEHRHQQALAISAREHCERLRGEVQLAVARLTEEQAEVADLETVSLTRVWAALKGSRAGDLDRERAEAEAARYVAADAQARYDAALADLGRIEARLAEGPAIAAELEAALAQKEAWLAAQGHPSASRLAAIAEERGTLLARLKEYDEASAAAVHADQVVTLARDAVGSARSWSEWDTFGGGGLITDMMKYDRLNQSRDLLRQSEHSIGVLRRELNDLQISTDLVRSVEVDDFVRVFDVWFDNIFSDWAVRRRVVEADERLTGVAEWLGRLRPWLAEQQATTARSLDTLDRERADQLES